MDLLSQPTHANPFEEVMDRIDNTGNLLLGSTKHLLGRLKEAYPMPFLLDPGFKDIMALYEAELTLETAPERLKFIRQVIAELYNHYTRLSQSHGQRPH